MSAEIQKITTEEQYEHACEALEKLWDAPKGTPEHQAKEVLHELVRQYEENSTLRGVSVTDKA